MRDPETLAVELPGERGQRCSGRSGGAKRSGDRSSTVRCGTPGGRGGTVAQARLDRVTSQPAQGVMYLDEYTRWCRRLGDRELFLDRDLPGLLDEIETRLETAEHARRDPPGYWTAADWTRCADYCEKLTARRDAIKARMAGHFLTRERTVTPTESLQGDGETILDPFQ